MVVFFVVVDCGVFLWELVVLELFGYKKGVFIGVVEDKSGVFVVVEYGILFLDEIGNLNMEM